MAITKISTQDILKDSQDFKNIQILSVCQHADFTLQISCLAVYIHGMTAPEGRSLRSCLLVSLSRRPTLSAFSPR